MCTINLSQTTKVFRRNRARASFHIENTPAPTQPVRVKLFNQLQ